MSIPSLSLWSSIKIPLPPLNSNRTRRGRSSSIPYVGSNEGTKRGSCVRKEEPVREMVNLKIPNQLVKGKENSSPVTCTCSEIHRCPFKNTFTKSSKKRPKKVDLVTVPEVPVRSRNKLGGITETLKIFRGKQKRFPKSFSFNFGDRNHVNLEMSTSELYADIEDEDLDDWIPSVKPWTLDELEEINKKYKQMEDRIKRIATTKRKINSRRGNVLMEDNKREDFLASISNTKCNVSLCSESVNSDSDVESNDVYFDCEWSPSDSDASTDCEYVKSNSKKQDLLPKIKSEEESYYQSKLAKLYLIELGIKV